MLFRELTKKDIHQIFEVRAATRENRMTKQDLAAWGITEQSVLHELQNDSRGWVCQDSSRIVGFTIGNGRTGEVQVLAIRPEYEGRGVGKKLMQLVQDWLFSLGHCELWLLENPDPNIRAYGFYRSLGWHPTGEYQKGEQILKLGPVNSIVNH